MLDNGLEQIEKGLCNILLLHENVLTTTTVTTLKVELEGKNIIPSSVGAEY